MQPWMLTPPEREFIQIAPAVCERLSRRAHEPFIAGVALGAQGLVSDSSSKPAAGVISRRTRAGE